MTTPFYTIGHSTHSIAECVQLLRASQVELVVDVRHIPRSRTNPQFNREILPSHLKGVQMSYVHLPVLGGLRSHGLKDSPNLLWQNIRFRNYADYALSEDFHHGLEELRNLGHERPSAIMCAEAVWWRCHRRIIADYLICAGERVFHILGNRIDTALLTPGAILHGDGRVLYPPLETEDHGSADVG